MQYQVPQFIETEDKIIGPLTVKQFVFLSLAGLGLFTLYFFLTTFLWFIVLVVFGSIALVITFGRYNGRPVSSIMFAALAYFWKPRRYVWKRKEELAALRAEEAQRGALKNLWLRLNIGKESVPQREAGTSPLKSLESRDRFEAIRKTTGEAVKARRVDYR